MAAIAPETGGGREHFSCLAASLEWLGLQLIGQSGQTGPSGITGSRSGPTLSTSSYADELLLAWPFTSNGRLSPGQVVSEPCELLPQVVEARLFLLYLGKAPTHQRLRVPARTQASIDELEQFSNLAQPQPEALRTLHEPDSLDVTVVE
jgi:hypothetical protein